jgi:hypothetical protein
MDTRPAPGHVALAALLLAIVSLPGRSGAQLVAGDRDPATPSITTSVTEQVQVPAARATIFAELRTSEALAAAAAQGNAEARERVLAALDDVGVPASQVGPSGWAMGEEMPMRGGRPMDDTGSTPTEVAAGLRIEVEPLDRLEDVLQALAAAGVTAVPVVRFAPGDVEEAMADATRRAVGRARAQAEQMADAAGGSLGELRSLTTQPFYGLMDASQYMSIATSFNRGPVTLQPSEVSVRVTITGTWRFVAR